MTFIADRAYNPPHSPPPTTQDTVRNRPDLYNEAVLAKPPGEYSAWILDPKTWGGEIELFILSQYYGAEIVAIEIKSQHSYVYGACAWAMGRGGAWWWSWSVGCVWGGCALPCLALPCLVYVGRWLMADG
jgi:hypothetical protein